MHGSLKKGQLPLNLKLYNVDLPWLKTAIPLVNELCEDGTLEVDIRIKRAE